MRGVRLGLMMGVFAAAWWPGLPAALAQDPPVVGELNNHSSVQGAEDSKSYRTLLDAYLEMGDPPSPISYAFGQHTIHPKMAQWSSVAAWAESNPGMAEAILAVRKKPIFGLPYGLAGLESKYREANLVAQIGEGERLHVRNLGYLRAMETIAAYSAAETYRLLEAGQYDRALDLHAATLNALRQICDRRFIEEVEYGAALLIGALSNTRDMVYLYHTAMPVSVPKADPDSDEDFPPSLTRLAKHDIPFLRPDYQRLEMPEGDRILAAAIIRAAFDDGEQADADHFSSTFGSIQAGDAPLTLWGAARRWKNIANVHASLTDSLDRLKLVYDDWWRRWRVPMYDPVLDIPAQFERTNPVRHAAVTYSLQPIEHLFDLRNNLVTAVNGTAMAVGLAAYHAEFGAFPDKSEKLYTQFVRKRSDLDQFNIELGAFKYYVLTERTAVDTSNGRLWFDGGTSLLWSLGQDHFDDRCQSHSDLGELGTDILIWPAVKAVSREQGLLP